MNDIKELNLMEIEQVAGGISNDAGYSSSLTAAAGFLAIAMTAPISMTGVAIFGGASIISSGIAMSFSLGNSHNEVWMNPRRRG